MPLMNCVLFHNDICLAWLGFGCLCACFIRCLVMFFCFFFENIGNYESMRMRCAFFLGLFNCPISNCLNACVDSVMVTMLIYESLSSIDDGCRIICISEIKYSWITLDDRVVL